jgi:hypothetical protein
MKLIPRSRCLDDDPKFCMYDCIGHKGTIEFHHPCSEYPLVGINLCEAHHSLMTLGRKKSYPFEMDINKALDQMRLELLDLQLKAVTDEGLSKFNIDKK